MFPLEVVAQVPALHVVHEQVEVLAILEGGHHVDDEAVTDGGEELLLLQDVVQTIFGEDPGLVHDFEGVVVVVGFVDDFVDSAEGSLAQDPLELEPVSGVCIRADLQSA